MKETSDDKTKRVVHLIQLLLDEPKIREKVICDFAPQKRDHCNILVIMNIKKIRFGKHNWNGFGGFWNNLIKCYEEISFSDFFIKTWDALSDMTTGNPLIHKAVVEGLSRETLLRGIKNGEYNFIVDRFLDVVRHLTDEGYWKTIGTKTDLNDQPSHHVNGCPYAGGVEIQLGAPKAPPVNWRVVDSLGDTFEIISARWVGGMKH
jgi:hypothetical protein